MNFVEQQQDRDYSDKEEEEQLQLQLEDEEELEDELITTTSTAAASKLPFSSTNNSPSSSSSPSEYRDFMFQKQNPWLPIPSSSDHHHQQQQSLNFDNNNKLDFMDLSLGNNNNNETSGGGSSSSIIEKEHMFDKVVTPSDVGKLNRLVIPKQHAEKYFPLDSSSNEKGLLLNFEDRNGKPWRFRYSYWNSSQSYVMTKGWSRFVKEKKLDAGDIVSFQRGVGESAKHNLYIDWRRRPNAPDPTSFTQFDLQNQLHFPQSSAAVKWGRLYSLPQPLSPSSMYRPPFEQSHHQFHHMNYSIQPYHQNRHHHHHNYHHPQQQQISNYGNNNAVSQQYYLRPPPPGTLQFGGVQGEQAPMVIDSVPVVHGRSVGKRLRLFGVNMECSSTTQQDHHQIHDHQYHQFSSSSDNSIQQQQGGGGGSGGGGSFSPHHIYSSSVVPQQTTGGGSSSGGGGGTISPTEADSRKGKSKSSLSFDLDL